MLPNTIEYFIYPETQYEDFCLSLSPVEFLFSSLHTKSRKSCSCDDDWQIEDCDYEFSLSLHISMWFHFLDLLWW